MNPSASRKAIIRTELPSAFTGFRTLLSKEIERFFRVAGQTILSPLISSSLYLLIFGVNLAKRIDIAPGVSYLQFIIPGLVAMGLLNNAFQNAASSIITSKFHGDFQDLRVVPLTPLQIVWAYACAATLRGVVIGLGVAMVGQIFHYTQYGSLLAIHSPLWLLFFAACSGVTFGCLGLCVAIYSRSFDQVSAVSTFVLLPLIYLGGVFFPLSIMPAFWQVVSLFNPLLYLINGIRYAFLGMSDISILPVALLASGFVLLAYTLALLAVKKGNYGRF
ncbi:ABC transporter permease [Desulfurispirillum indicum]|uniref:Transport permease protein n=1 Tax=Desulfurispirillum indicum (strain ATCC BAA-1389 / DSM 22839 / S5) TaxID=653733 RepID=E6W3F1_DESIS|nr:ABC transporter permease [Desulfurispirillum indicum]ADU65744.1 ABC-2 type transporter [Desulfurispirillum indicum S5]UCZ57677.1 ABC transporter permease [Desulfurispirillum indicum]